jgi:uncharacterized protein YndB with AHSA1/START domain
MQLVDIAIDIEAPPYLVFDLFTTAEGLTQWMASEASVDLRPDGSWRWVHDDGNVCSGNYELIDRPNRLAFTYGWECGPFVDVKPGTTRVDVTFAPTGSGTRVHLRHEGLVGERPEQHAGGWTHFLGVLATFASTLYSDRQPKEQR